MAVLIDPDAPGGEALQAAAGRLAEGRLVAFPTETVYGLGARADDARAVAAIFAAKGRPSDHPLIVHVAGPEAIDDFTADVPAPAHRLMAAFWPGPLTLIVPRRPEMAAAAAGGAATIGLRCPSHPVARRLLQAARALGVPGVAAPSANRFGRVSPTRAEHVLQEFPDDDCWVLDGGPCEVGIESTIVDCSRGRPVLLRPGRVTAPQIEAVLGEPVRERDDQAPRAPGTLVAHYAPRARVRLMPAPLLQQALTVWKAAAAPAAKPHDASASSPQKQPRNILAVYSRTIAPPQGVLFRPMPTDAIAAAQELFAALREFDDQGATLIWVEEPPAGSAWDGVRDRLGRAAAAG